VGIAVLDAFVGYYFVTVKESASTHFDLEEWQLQVICQHLSLEEQAKWGKRL